MDDGIGLEITHQFFDNGLVGDRVDDDGQIGVGCQVLTPPGGEIVDRNDLIAALEEHFNHMGADLSEAAGYDYFFHFSPSDY